MYNVEEFNLESILYKGTIESQEDFSLDEAVGKLNWKRAHQNIAGKLFCEMVLIQA